jgi:hypothetical protein
VRNKLQTLALTATIVLYSCSKTEECLPDYVQPVLISYSQSDMDTIVFRRYITGTNFQQQVDSVFIKEIRILEPYPIGDSTYLFIRKNLLFNLHSGYDYEIYIPSTRRLVRVTEIVESPRVQKKRGFITSPCYSPIISFKRDGVLQNGKYLYIR